MITHLPTGTMTLARVDRAALDIADFFLRSKATHSPTPDQINFVLERYCDDPTINRTDMARIRVRVEQFLAEARS